MTAPVPDLIRDALRALLAATAPGADATLPKGERLAMVRPEAVDAEWAALQAGYVGADLSALGKILDVTFRNRHLLYPGYLVPARLEARIALALPDAPRPESMDCGQWITARAFAAHAALARTLAAAPMTAADRDALARRLDAHACAWQRETTALDEIVADAREDADLAESGRVGTDPGVRSGPAVRYLPPPVVLATHEHVAARIAAVESDVGARNRTGRGEGV